MLISVIAAVPENESFSWRRRDGPMPPHHIEKDGSLVVPSITRRYQGEYICTITTPFFELERTVQVIVTGMYHIVIDDLHNNLI